MATLSESESRRRYSWWWDSHISPKNSKWLQENLTDMDSKVKAMIKLIEEDADSFARRAEMYYKKRPELMKLVEEFYRAYRALAERYDYATGELRQAHKTMAEAFPNQIPFILSDDSSSASETAPYTPDRDFDSGIFLNSPFSNAKAQGLKSENEVESLKKALADLQDEKEALALQYQHCLETKSKLEEELNFAKNDSLNFSEQAKKAKIEFELLKEAMIKLKLEKNAFSVKNEDLAEKISSLESEDQYTKNELSRLISEKETGLVWHKQCLDQISDLEKKISILENNAKFLNDRAVKAESEVEKLKETLFNLNKEKEAVFFKYELCLKRISELEDEVKNLNSEIRIGSEKLKGAEEKCFLLEKSNQYLRLEADDLVKKIAIKDQELMEKHGDLEMLRSRIEDERLRFAQVEATLESLQNFHSQSQEAQNSLTQELKNFLHVLKDLEMSKQGLEEEVRRVSLENQNLNQLNLSSDISMKNLQDEIFSMRKMKEKLEGSVGLQMGQISSLQQEISRLKEEIKGLNNNYQALIEQVESAGLTPSCIGSSISGLRVENSKLKDVLEKYRDEKEALSKKLENMEELLKKNDSLERTLSAVNSQLEGTKEKVKALQEACDGFHGEKSALVSEKALLLSQLQIVTENTVKLLEKNVVLENSLSGANVELQGLREKSRSLENVCEFINNEKSDLVAERGILVIKLENVERRLEMLETRFTRLEEKYAGLETEKQSSHSQVEQLKFNLNEEKQERENFTLWSETRLASMENHILLLQEESKLRRKEFEEEIDRVVNAQFEIFILQTFIQDMEEKNYSLLIECQKHVEASKFTQKLISELESENLEQQVEAEFLLDEIEKLRLGIYKVFKALEIDPRGFSKDKTENEKVFLDRIFRSIEDLKGSVFENEEEKQRLLVENSVLLSLVQQMRFEGMEVDSEKKKLDLESKLMREKLSIMQNDQHELQEMNKQLRLEVSRRYEQEGTLEAEIKNLCMSQDNLQRSYCELQNKYSQIIEEKGFLLNKISNLAEEKFMAEEENDAVVLEALTLANLLTIFKSSATEKDEELKLASADLNHHQGLKIDLEKQSTILRAKLEMKEAENCFLKDSIDRLEMELNGFRESNEIWKQEVSIGKELLRQREAEVSETEQQLIETEKSKSDLIKTVTELKRVCEESKIVRENLESQILKLSEYNIDHNIEIECLRETNENLVFEIEEKRTIEVNRCLELQEKNNDFELWEAEATSFYFDLQISSIQAALFEDKVHELSEVCEDLKGESAVKTVAIEVMKERVGNMEGEVGRLKAQLSAYAPAIVSLRDSIASLEQNIFTKAKLNVANNPHPEAEETVIHSHEDSLEEPMNDQNPMIPNGVSDLWELQTRIKSFANILSEHKNKPMMREIHNTHPKASTIEIEELKDQERLQPEIAQVLNKILMKDIPLDQVSDSALFGKTARPKGGSDDQMLELWETAENRCFDPNGEQQFEDKELGIDKLELPAKHLEPKQETNNHDKKILERLSSDSQKLQTLKSTVQDLRLKLENHKKGKKVKDFDFGTVKEQIQEVEETVTTLVDFNGKLMKNVEEGCLRAPPRPEEVAHVRTQARKGSEKIGRLQLEVQKLQYVMLKLEGENKSRVRSRFSKSRTNIVLKDFIYIGSSSRRKKGQFCGCFRPSLSSKGGDIGANI